MISGEAEWSESQLAWLRLDNGREMGYHRPGKRLLASLDVFDVRIHIERILGAHLDHGGSGGGSKRGNH